MAAALGGTGLVLFWDQNASAQPGYCADVLLHETAVSWIRHKLTATTPKRPWLESREQYAARLRQVVADINCKFAVGDLCQRFPDRIDELNNKREGTVRGQAKTTHGHGCSGEDS